MPRALFVEILREGDRRCYAFNPCWSYDVLYFWKNRTRGRRLWSAEQPILVMMDAMVEQERVASQEAAAGVSC